MPFFRIGSNQFFTFAFERKFIFVLKLKNLEYKLITTSNYTRYYLFSPLYRQHHFALAEEPETARCHYLTPIYKFIDKFS